MGGVLRNLFGAGTWGTGGNLVAWIICGVLAGLLLRAKLKAQDALAKLHHQQAADQRQEHHDAAMDQIKLQLATHCTDLKQHITNTAGSGEVTR